MFFKNKDHNNPDRLTPSGLNSGYRHDAESFEEYRLQMRAIISAGRTESSPAEKNRAIEGNLPFRLVPGPECAPGSTKRYRRALLLSHGLTDSPFLMRELGEFFSENCFLVMSILLPGHGTRPGDLLDVEWEDWAKAVNFGAAMLAKEADQVYLAGHSTGAALSVYHSLHDPGIKGLFLFSPAMGITRIAGLANMHKLYSGAYTRGKWLTITPDTDLFKYESFAKNGAWQVHRLIHENLAILKTREITIPVFIAASKDDSTVHTDVTVSLFDKTKNPVNRMLLFTAEPGGNYPERINEIDIRSEDGHIISSAHTAILSSPDNPHYGARGTYKSCVHYLKDPGKYALCKEGKEDYLGEITRKNLKKGIIRRLSYNPEFDRMKTKLKHFIDNLP